MPSRLNVTPPPTPPGDQPTSRACEVWRRARETAENWLTDFDAAQLTRGGGQPSAADQDLLRAMLVFACGGLDSAIRHLARDCAEPMLERSENLRRAAEEFARRKLGMDAERSRFLVGLVRGGDPELDKKLVEALIQEETERSLQSHEAVLNIATHFEVEGDELVASGFRARSGAEPSVPLLACP